MKEDITCIKCGLVNDCYTYERGPHIGARCNGCDTFIKWIPQNNPNFIIPFGKFKGRELSSMKLDHEVGYLQWLLSTDIKLNLRKKIEDHLKTVI